MLLRNVYGELSFDVLWQVLDAFHIVPCRTKHLTQSLHQRTSFAIPNLNHVCMSVILIAVKALVLELHIIGHTINHHLHVSRFSMLRHPARHCLQQMMKLHWNLESLSQSGTIYEFLVDGLCNGSWTLRTHIYFGHHHHGYHTHLLVVESGQRIYILHILYLGIIV